MATQLKEPEPNTPPPEIVEEEEAQFPPSEAVEALARVKGWRPKEEFPGDEAKWLPADDFLKRADENLGLSRAEKDQMRKRISVLEGTIKKLTKSEMLAHETSLQDIERRMEAAVESGDLGEFRSLFEKLGKVQSAITDSNAAPSKADMDDAYFAFREDNSWYDSGALQAGSDTERAMRLHADRLADRLAAQGLAKELSPADFFARVADETKDAFPDWGKKAPRTKPQSDVAGVTRGQQKGGAKTYADLPADAKRQCDRFVANGTSKSREDYVSRYQFD